ncbi:dihydroorotate oxidase B, catalytic subunit [Streptomyces sp. 2323.1]|uniref:dihydroorotate dehydrogenase n=1 Tax=Streptomyces sp. 2323.1 TaxID=1938841 RepID=UPI000BB77F23|nr:dihydroorotate dehydrogenase [Streptomyces sp. 2323.1]SOE15869.1 dihydroorotate oxidase B, catalytic subunit [Streptomyces sp. 2323.1]
MKPTSLSSPRSDRVTVDLSTDLAGLRLPHPVLLASGTAMYGKEISAFLNLARTGGVITKSVLSRPWNGMPPVRGTTTPSGMLNCIGLQGEGVGTLLDEHLPWLREQGARTVVSIAGHSIDEYAEVAAAIAAHPEAVETVELNISCPNVEDRNKIFSRDPDSAAQVVAGVRAALPDVTLLAKLSPDVTDMVEIAHACVAAGADALSLINTLTGAAIDLRTLRPTLSGTFGGLSGPAIKPVAVRCIWQVHQALPEVPILGGGGVRSGRDALELTLAGASALSIGTVNFEEPDAADRITAELTDLLAERGIMRYRDAIGLAHRADTPTKETS